MAVFQFPIRFVMTNKLRDALQNMTAVGEVDDFVHIETEIGNGEILVIAGLKEQLPAAFA